ncbi:ABC transporter permease [bacterium]|nr:ABC transporter permease [bacterium]
MKMGFLIKEGFRSFGRSRQPAIITIVTIFLSLLILSFVIGGWQTVDSLLRSSRSNVDVEVFLEDGLSKEQREQIYAKIFQAGEISSARYIDKGAAKKRFINEFGEGMFDLVDENPLPESVLIEFNPAWMDSERILKFVENIRKVDGVWEIPYQSSVLKTLEKYQDKMFYIGILVFGVLLFILIVFISNTIKLSVYARTDVIGIMRLVGATPTFIKMPFLIEGIILGFWGSVLALVFLWIFKIWVIPQLVFIFDFQLNLNLEFHFAMILTGIIIGFLGSFRAVQNYVGR